MLERLKRAIGLSRDGKDGENTPMGLLVLPRVEFWEKAGYSSDGMKHAFAEQRKASLSIALPFDQFELGHMPFYHAI